MSVTVFTAGKNRRPSVPLVILLTLALGASVFSCSRPSATFITESEVRSIMDSVEAATLEKDIDGVVEHMARDVIINVTVDTPFGPQRQRLTREEFREQTRKGWAMAGQYDYRREKEGISIAEDGLTATVRTDIRETMTIQGRRVRTTTRETATLAVVDGRILVTALEAVVSRR